MELRHARYFVAVAEERSFTRAAARLNLAQSPLSQQIRQLEREIGVELLTRTTRSVTLTHAGSIFLKYCLALLEVSDDAVEAARKAARGELGRLTVGFTGSATYEILPTLVRAYTDRYPDVELRVRSDMMTPLQVEALLNGTLAVGVLRPPVTAGGLVVETIRSEAVVALLSSRHPATVGLAVDLKDLRDEWFISYPHNPPSTMHGVLQSACRTAGFVPKIRQTVDDSAALVSLVAADMGVALVPASLQYLKMAGATFRPLRDTVTVGLAIAYREGAVDPLVRWFVETARSVVRSRKSVELSADSSIMDEGYFGLGI